jgi:hypothetical protein
MMIESAVAGLFEWLEGKYLEALKQKIVNIF